MSDLLCFATIALAGFTQTSLQLSFGGLILLYHASMGHHRRRKTGRLVNSYVCGALSFSFLASSAFAYWISQFFSEGLSLEMLVVSVGVFLACAAIMWLLYYRTGPHTELWLPRSFARYLSKKSKNTNDQIGAYSLGLVSVLAEMPFSLAIYFIVANCMVAMSADLQFFGLIEYLAIIATPMFALRFLIKNGHSAVAIQKSRQKNKLFARIIASSSYLLLSVFILSFWIYR